MRVALANNTAHRTRPSPIVSSQVDAGSLFALLDRRSPGRAELQPSSSGMLPRLAPFAALPRASAFHFVVPLDRKGKEKRFTLDWPLSHLNCSASNETSHARDGVHHTARPTQSNWSAPIPLFSGVRFSVFKEKCATDSAELRSRNSPFEVE